jgi:hypothetical protein
MENSIRFEIAAIVLVLLLECPESEMRDLNRTVAGKIMRDEHITVKERDAVAESAYKWGADYRFGSPLAFTVLCLIDRETVNAAQSLREAVRGRLLVK